MDALFEFCGVAALKHHWTNLLASAFACSVIVQLSQLVSASLFPETYPKLMGSKRLNWDGNLLCLISAWHYPQFIQIMSNSFSHLTFLIFNNCSSCGIHSSCHHYC